MTGEVVFGLRILAAVLLYSFLGYAVYLLWSDLRSEAKKAGTQKIPPIRLTWQIQGQDQTKELMKSQINIGRDPACDCPLANETVSARHAKLTYHHKQWWVEDLNSTNGTFVNEEKVDTPTVIVSGDEVRCGQVVLMVQ